LSPRRQVRIMDGVIGTSRPSGRAAKTSVLIVDDDPGFGRAAAEMLTSRGYRVLGQATTRRAAFAECEQLEPDAVLLDVRLPDGDGVAFAKRLLARSGRTRVLLTSTDRKAVPAGLLRQSGAVGFIPKVELANSDLDRFLKR
jgi:DNA-binding NarL/FixJ family response regulator